MKSDFDTICTKETIQKYLKEYFWTGFVQKKIFSGIKKKE